MHSGYLVRIVLSYSDHGQTRCQPVGSWRHNLLLMMMNGLQYQRRIPSDSGDIHWGNTGVGSHGERTSDC